MVRAALREDGRYLPAHNLEGLLHLEKGEWALARTSFGKCLDLRPGAFEAANNAGYAVLRQVVAESRLADPARVTAADRAFRQAEEEAPREPAPWWNRGVLLYLTGKEEEGLRHLEHAVGLGLNLRAPGARAGKDRLAAEYAAAPAEATDTARLRARLADRNEGRTGVDSTRWPRRVLVAQLEKQWGRVRHLAAAGPADHPGPGAAADLHASGLGKDGSGPARARLAVLAEAAATLGLMDVQLVREVFLKESAHGGAMESR